jgi:uncharacterized tellurite resistance protein B-like protein
MVMDLVFSLRDGIHSEFDAYGMECIFLILWSASLPMPQISYENEESVLSFEHQDMINAQELNSLRKDEKMDLKDFAVPDEDRLPFTKFMAYMARVDGDISLEEKQAIDSLIYAMGLDENGVKEVYEVMENGASVQGLSKEFKSPRSPLLLLQELITIAFIDLSYDDVEKKAIREIASEFGISEERIIALEDWVVDGIEWRKNGLILLKPEGE